MKRFLMFAVVTVAIVIPAMTWAQEEGVTLEGLAETVIGLSERIEALESLYMPAAITNDDGSCQLAVGFGGLFDGQGGTHPSTMAAYMAISDNRAPVGITIGSVYVMSGGEVEISFSILSPVRANVVEIWNGCEFQSHSRFWEEDFSGNVTYLD